MRTRKKPASWVRIAKERIDILFREAQKQASKYPKLANRYVFIARKIGMRYNVPIPTKYKRLFCHHCHHYFLLGKNCIVRTNPKTKCVEYCCKDCGKKSRYGYSKENKT